MIWLKLKKGLKTNHPKHGDVTIDEVEIGQFESLTEAANDAGGEDKLLEYINRSVLGDAKVAPRNLGKTIGAEATVQDILDKGRELAKSFSLKNVGKRGAGKAQKAESYDAIKALISSGQEYTKEQLMALLNA